MVRNHCMDYMVSHVIAVSGYMCMDTSMYTCTCMNIECITHTQLKNADYFSQYVTNEDFECYVSRKRSDQCYGNNIEMQAIAEMYNRVIEVFQYSTGWCFESLLIVCTCDLYCRRPLPTGLLICNHTCMYMQMLAHTLSHTPIHY